VFQAEVLSIMDVTTAKREPTILVVDDDPLNVKVLTAILRTGGYLTLSARDGTEARRQARTELPDLILLDVMMPGESGFDTCVKLKQEPKTTDIPVIFVSAINDVSSKVKGFDVGAVDYITKPFEKAEVLARTRLHLKLKFSYQAVIDGQAARLKQIQDAQQSILVRPDDLPDARFGINYVPILEAGGDFYDVFRISEGIFGYFVADISGHDLGASYVTSALKALINQNATLLHTPVETVKIMNSVLTSIMTDGKYLTACYAHLNRSQSKLAVISAGHPPVIYVGADGRTESLEATGDILGTFETVLFEPTNKVVSKGDRFFVYTDGLIEEIGKDNKNRHQGMKQLMQACASTQHLPIEKAVKEITSSLFPENSQPQDDLLLLGVEI
jgi:sigma-B regulation protein RsbU (phosphoserine phosphatase)